MSKAHTLQKERLLFPVTVGNWREYFRHAVQAYRPDTHDRRFWIAQGLTLLVAAIHYVVEAYGLLPYLGKLYFIPISIYFVPLVYAALNFGFRGSLATALWVTALAMPEWVLWHHGLERWGIIIQMMILNVAALFVGYRVEVETRTRRAAEHNSIALGIAEKKYRSLFEFSPTPLLILTGESVLEANPAAGELFNRSVASVRNVSLVDLVGAENTRKLLANAGRSQRNDLTLKMATGRVECLQPVLFEADREGNNRNQMLLVLRDVTESRNREAGLKAYAASVIHTQEEERKRIARELHDDLIQTLVLLHRQLDSTGSNPSRIVHDANEARRTVEEVVRRLRDFAASLRPPALDELGIVVSVRRLLAALADQTGAGVELKIAGEPRRLPAGVELGLFRIAQEALRNVERHARATSVTVTIAFARDKVELEVADNGVGFAMQPISGFAGTPQLGIIGMQERADLLGGKLEICSSPGRGTAVTIAVGPAQTG